MVGQFRRWAWAGLLGSTLAHASVDLGTVQVELAQMSIQETYMWNSAKGVYELSAERLRYDLALQGTGALRSLRLLTPVYEIMETDRVELQIMRTGDQAALQWFAADPEGSRRPAAIETQDIRLLPRSSWTRFEKGQPIEAVIKDPAADRQSVEELLHELAAEIYRVRVRPAVKEAKVPGYRDVSASNEPRVAVTGVRLSRSIEISRDKITISMRVPKVMMEGRVTGAPTP